MLMPSYRRWPKSKRTKAKNIKLNIRILYFGSEVSSRKGSEQSKKCGLVSSIFLMLSSVYSLDSSSFLRYFESNRMR